MTLFKSQIQTFCISAYALVTKANLKYVLIFTQKYTSIKSQTKYLFTICLQYLHVHLYTYVYKLYIVNSSFAAFSITM